MAQDRDWLESQNIQVEFMKWWLRKAEDEWIREVFLNFPIVELKKREDTS